MTQGWNKDARAENPTPAEAVTAGVSTSKTKAHQHGDAQKGKKADKKKYKRHPNDVNDVTDKELDKVIKANIIIEAEKEKARASVEAKEVNIADIASKLTEDRKAVKER